MAWHPTLDDIERMTQSPQRVRDNRDPSTLTANALGVPGRCWCGLPCYHDWPGKAQGGPHPRISEDSAS